MNEFFINSAFAGVTISLVSYMLGMYLKKRFKLGIFNPLLIAIAVTMVILFALNVDYDTYNTGAKYLSWLLTPSTVCLAIPLYEQISLLKKNFAAVEGGELRQELLPECLPAFYQYLLWQSFLDLDIPSM